MRSNKNSGNNLVLFLFKNLCLILGLNIFLTSVFTIIKAEFKKNNFDSRMNLNIKDIRYDHDA